MKESEGDMIGHNSGGEDTCSLAAQAFLDNHISVVRLNIQTGKALVLKSDMDPEAVGAVFDWEELIERYVQRRVYPPDKNLVYTLHPEWLRQSCVNKKICKCVELRCMSGADQYEWVELNAYMVGPDQNTILVCTKNINEAKLVRSIVEFGPARYALSGEPIPQNGSATFH